MFLHTHPYEPFLFGEATKVIVGTLPPPRFTSRDLKEGDVDFCYGSRDGQLWPILNEIFGLNLKFETTQEAIDQRKDFLRSRKIAICDIVASAERDKVDASDLGMANIKLRDLIGYLHQYPNLNTLLFTGGNSKNGPEFLFRKQLKTYGLTLEVVSAEIPRIHKFVIPGELAIGGRNVESLRGANQTRPLQNEAKKPKKSSEMNPFLQGSLRNGGQRTIKTVSLTAPSGAANRAVGSLDSYKAMKSRDPDFNTFDFRVLQYRPFF